MTEIAARVTTAKADSAFGLSSHTLLLLGEIPDRIFPQALQPSQSTLAENPKDRNTTTLL
jgi:hypothetical protein